VPHRCLHASDQFAEAEGLRHIIVGTEFEAEHDVELFGDGTQHDYRNVGVASHLATDLRAWPVRKTQVEKDHVGLDPGEGRKRRVGIGGEIDGESLALQTGGERFSVRGVIVDDENRPAMLFRSYCSHLPQALKAHSVGL
jgi:hypothetical protein